jgi:hypothetical protein
MLLVGQVNPDFFFFKKKKTETTWLKKIRVFPALGQRIDPSGWVGSELF